MTSITQNRWKRISEYLYKKTADIQNIDKKNYIIPIDFTKPWTKILTSQSGKVGICLITKSYNEAYFAAIPFLLALVINYQSYRGFVFVVAGLLLTFVASLTFEYYYQILQTSILSSLYTTAHKFFLTVDPIYHSTRSSGQIISKIQRTVNSYEFVMDRVVYDFIKLIVSASLLVCILFYYSPLLGIISIVSVTLIFCGVTCINSNISRHITQKRIEGEDKLKSSVVENIQQFALIRSSFATSLQQKKVHTYGNASSRAYITSWNLYTIIFNLNYLLFIISFLLIGTVVYYLMSQNLLTIVSAIAILTAYFTIAGEILYQGNTVAKTITNIHELDDFFIFVRGFGVRTYPVLENTAY